MKIAGIIAEYNPFHTGHAYHIAQTRAALGPESAVVAVMSGNWVQGAECAIADKWTRARLALLGGADLVLELPTLWAVSSAETFARGGVEILDACGVVDVLSFGSESGELEPLAQAAACLDTPAYRLELNALLPSGLSFPRCRQLAAQNLLGKEAAAVLASPNNNLGIEYLRAISRLGSAMAPMTVRREGAAHNSLSQDRPAHLSATQVRACLRQGDRDTPAPYLVPGALDLLTEPLPRLEENPTAQRLVLARLRTMSELDWAALPDSGAGEGLPSRLVLAGRRAASLDEFYDIAKTKRYTHARLRRLALWAYLGLTAQDRPPHVPYLRVLAFNARGQEVLARMRKTAQLPILVKPARARRLSPQAQRLFELEARCTDLYDLLRPDLTPGGREWRTSPCFQKEAPQL